MHLTAWKARTLRGGGEKPLNDGIENLEKALGFIEATLKKRKKEVGEKKE